MNTMAVMVAAGMSSRMNSFKPMLRLAGSTVIKTAIDTLLSAGVTEIVVVTGNNAEQLARHVSREGVSCVFNPRYAETDMFYSASLGLAACYHKCDNVFFLPADVPLFAPESLQALLKHQQEQPVEILIPSYKGKPGHPVLLSDKAVGELLRYDGEGGLRGAMNESPCSKAYLDLPDLGLILDADRPEDYQLLNQYYKTRILERPIACATRISLTRKDKFFDDDLAELLRQVELTSSLSRACQVQGISYSNGWKAVKIAEGQFGFELLSSQRGGAQGGASALTEQAKKLLSTYHAFRQEMDRFTELKFIEYFGDYQEDKKAH